MIVTSIGRRKSGMGGGPLTLSKLLALQHQCSTFNPTAVHEKEMSGGEMKKKNTTPVVLSPHPESPVLLCALVCS